MGKNFFSLFLFCVCFLAFLQAQNTPQNPKGIQATKSTNGAKQTNGANSTKGTQNAQAPKKQGDKREDSNIIAGIAITVNGDPITLYQIQQMEKNSKVSKQKAIDILIAQALKAQEIKRLHIQVDDARVEQEIENIAKHNGMDRDSFMSALMNQGINYTKYKDDLKEQIETQELLRNVLLSSVNTAGESEMRTYYDKHKEEFTIPKEVHTIRYVSKDPEALKKAIQNPMMKITGVDTGEEKISLDSLNPQVAQVFIQTPKSNFTPILNAGEGSYVSFFIKDKVGEAQIPFEQAKNFIAQKLVESSQERILDEYFEKIRIKAKINIIRE
ncbi:hypothetical protein BKH46_03535 [Helicobacter sp. 12S02634-8]|uniref:SurA N-terminal domain-containing protein n=1 Tax=Helicobacter sp. 12S02634-8 TaxID=1476199 RepID=UPI000BA6667D|nr:SurA N-terminal domain-containing protein [Helicobacter sp. 12S02634-8]PAF47512.1 hypothetical protein BKH46_03535 [Helicobacter sp. 12S02634-8]